MRKKPRKRTPRYKRPYNRDLYRRYVKKYLEKSYQYLQVRDYEKSSKFFEWIISYIIDHKINSSDIKFYEECKRRVESESERNTIHRIFQPCSFYYLDNYEPPPTESNLQIVRNHLADPDNNVNHIFSQFNGETALIIIVKHGKKKDLESILAKNPDLTIKDINNKTALDYARKMGANKKIELLEAQKIKS
jgi:ankyrin repeat protein